MSLSIIASSTMVESGYGLDTRGEITWLPLSGRLNDYWGVHKLFTSDADDAYLEQGYPSDIWEFSMEKVKKMQELDNINNYGAEVTEFLARIVESGAEKIYIKVV